MSNAENLISIDADEIRVNLGPSRFAYMGGSTLTRRNGGVVVEFNNWTNTESGESFHNLLFSENSEELPNPDDVRSAVIEQLRQLTEPGLKREQLALLLNPVGARLSDQTPVSFLVLPTQATVEQEEGGWDESRIPPVNRIFDFRGINKGYIHSYQMAMKALMRSDIPLTVGEVRNLSATELRIRGTRVGQRENLVKISLGSVKFAKALLNNR